MAAPAPPDAGNAGRSMSLPSAAGKAYALPGRSGASHSPPAAGGSYLGGAAVVPPSAGAATKSPIQLMDLQGDDDEDEDVDSATSQLPQLHVTPNHNASGGGSSARTRALSEGAGSSSKACAAGGSSEHSARDILNQGLVCYERGQLMEACQHLSAAEVAFRELGDTESADEASRNRELIQARSRVLAMASPPQAAPPQLSPAAAGAPSPAISPATAAAGAAATAATAAAGAPSPASSLAAGAPSPATSPATAAERVGIGVSLASNGQGKGMKIISIRAGGPAALSGKLCVGDSIIKINNESTWGKTEQEIIDMVVGPPGSSVTLTVENLLHAPLVVTAPFQELPFDLKKDKKNKNKQKKNQEYLRATHSLYGGGTLPPGFEHLESLRSAQPYTSPSLSVRTITLQRQAPID